MPDTVDPPGSLLFAGLEPTSSALPDGAFPIKREKGTIA
jgi:hypothetical protein